MKIHYYGTGAAEGIPALFCACEVCTRARQLGGRNLRTRSQALIDDTLLMDFSPDTYMHYVRDGLPLPSIRHLLITHAHPDHLFPDDIRMRTDIYAYPADEIPLRIYGSKTTGEMLTDALEPGRVEFIELDYFKPVSLAGYTVTPLLADHGESMGLDCMLYCIEKDSQSMLYAHDTGYFPEETWAFLQTYPHRFDFVSLDANEAVVYSRKNHMCLEVALEVRDRLRAMGRMDAQSIVCLNHFSHNGKSNYADFAAETEAKGVLVSYDGLEITF